MKLALSLLVLVCGVSEIASAISCTGQNGKTYDYPGDSCPAAPAAANTDSLTKEEYQRLRDLNDACTKAKAGKDANAINQACDDPERIGLTNRNSALGSGSTETARERALNRRTQYKKDIVTACTAAEKEMNKALSDQRSACGAIGAKAGFTSVGECIEKTNSCNDTIRLPVNLFSRGGNTDSPQVVVDQNCKFLNRGMCADLKEDAKSEQTKMDDYEKQVKDAQKTVRDQQKALQEGQQALTENLDKLQTAQQDVVMTLKKRLADMDDKIQDAIQAAQNQVDEANNKKMEINNAIRQADLELQKNIDSANLQCIQDMKLRTKEVEEKMAEIRAKKTRTTSAANAIALQAALKRAPQQAFQTCMNGAERTMAIQAAIRQRLAAQAALKEQQGAIDQKIAQLQQRLKDVIAKEPQQKQMEVEQANQAMEKIRKDQATMMQKYQMQALQGAQELMVANQDVQNLQNKYSTSKATHTDLQRGIAIAKQSGDNCSKRSDDKDGYSLLSKAATANGDAFSNLEATYAACCEAPDAEELAGFGSSLDRSIASQASNTPSSWTQPGGITKRKTQCETWGKTRDIYRDTGSEKAN